MNEYYVKALKSNLESSLRELLIETLQNAQELPEMMHGTMVMSAAGNFCDSSKKGYSQLKRELENLNQDIGMSEHEYKLLVDNITTKVLNEFIQMP